MASELAHTEPDASLTGYEDLLAHVKAEVLAARMRTVRAVNTELLDLYSLRLTHPLHSGAELRYLLLEP